MNKPTQHELISLAKYYQTGQNDKTEKLALSMIKKFPKYQFAWKVLGAVLRQTGRETEALVANKKSVELSPKDFEAHNNLGITLKELGRLEEAEVSIKKTIALKSDFHEAHNNLGIILGTMNRFEEAVRSCRYAVALKSDYAEGHNSLGIMLKELKKFEEAEVSFRNAISLKSDYAEAYSNLGITIAELGRLEEAEINCRRAISLKSDYAEAHSNLGIILYGDGDIDSAINSIERANYIDPKSSFYSLFLNILQSRKIYKNVEASIDNINNSDSRLDLPSKIFISNRPVEKKLLAYLYKIKLIDLDKENDPSFGNSRGSYDLFENNSPVVQKMAGDFKQLLMEAVGSEIFIYDSFFSIFGAGGGTVRHHHLSQIDQDPRSNLGNKKYSVVYYLSTGDQNCSEPGILKFYDPSEDVLPSKGMITIFPASRHHSSVYGGKTARVIVGINFYSL